MIEYVGYMSEKENTKLLILIPALETDARITTTIPTVDTEIQRFTDVARRLISIETQIGDS